MKQLHLGCTLRHQIEIQTQVLFPPQLLQLVTLQQEVQVGVAQEVRVQLIMDY